MYSVSVSSCVPGTAHVPYRCHVFLGLPTGQVAEHLGIYTLRLFVPLPWKRRPAQIHIVIFNLLPYTSAQMLASSDPESLVNSAVSSIISLLFFRSPSFSLAIPHAHCVPVGFAVRGSIP